MNELIQGFVNTCPCSPCPMAAKEEPTLTLTVALFALSPFWRFLLACLSAASSLVLPWVVSCCFYSQVSSPLSRPHSCAVPQLPKAELICPSRPGPKSQAPFACPWDSSFLVLGEGAGPAEPQLPGRVSWLWDVPCRAD